MRLVAISSLAFALLTPRVDAATSVNAADTRFVTPVGRSFVVGTGLGFSWLGGGLKVQHTGTVLRATCSTAYGARTFKLSFYQSSQGNVPWEGVSWVPATGQNESIVVSVGSGEVGVHVMLNTPPDYWADGAGAAVILSLESDGTFLPAPPASTRVLHTLGDSITAATNIHGGFHACADGGQYADYSSSWTGLLCSLFGADCTTVAVGGKGLVKNCCDTGTVVPEFYTQTRKNDADGTFPFHDAAPQGVLVYLGTNDYSRGGSPALDAAFTAGFLALMHNVTTRYYPGANVTFFAVLGPMSPTLPSNAMAAAVAQGTAEGLRVVFVNASTACGDDLSGCHDGCAGHPGVASHRNIARIVAPYVEAALGWPVPGVL